MKSYVFPHLPDIEALAVTTGFFDGLHKGHVAVFQQLKSIAREHHLPTAVVSYAPHPRVVLGKAQGLQFLNTAEEKKQLLAAQDIDYFIVIPFTKAFSQLSASDFIQQYLYAQLHVKHWVIGYNHRMGNDSGNDFSTLENFCKTLKMSLYQTPAVMVETEKVSSTGIRNALAEGNIELANSMLNYDYSIKGTVEHGKKNGRTIGFPTANLALDKEKLLPQDAVYAVWVDVLGKRYKGILNIGFRPTIDDKRERSVEVHIFDFDQNIYGEMLTVNFVAHIRNEQKFDSLNALKAAIEKDKQQALQLLS